MLFYNSDGLYHRLDGPAIIWDDGTFKYAINGLILSEEDYWKHPDVVPYRNEIKIKEALGIK